MKTRTSISIFILTIISIAIMSCKTLTRKLTDHVKINSEQFEITIKNGYFQKWSSVNDHVNYIPEKQIAPLLTLQVANENYLPSSMSWDANKKSALLNFDKVGVKVDISITSKKTHVVFEVIAIEPKEIVDLLIWGPYPTTINRTIGEIVGVVRDQDYAIGIQSLNSKTIGGYPINDDDRMPVFNAYDHNHYDDIWGHEREKHRFWGVTAKRTEYGSVLQAYCRNRDKDRVTSHWEASETVAPAYNDGGVIGSKIALFGCLKDQVLQTLSKIELAEDLPHPVLDGEWLKTSSRANSSYIITEFGTETIDEILTIAKSAGLICIYHPGPFENWGHFDLNKEEFPNNWKSMKACVEKAAKEGIWLGVHTLSNFITTNDPYVTPKPDTRLASFGSSLLTRAINSTDTEIPVKDARWFKHKSTLNTIRINEELIQYQSISTSPTIKLIGCRRGAWGTEAAAHEKDEPAARLMDHGYKVFLTDAELTKEVAQQLANFYNFTGLRMIALDGLEGAWSTGLGTYGRTIFTETWYGSLNKKQKNEVVNAASNPGHFNWHVNSRFDWGDESGSLRTGQTAYRIMNQPFYSRNYLPHFLGGFKITKKTTLADAEWFLARVAGFDAGFAIMLSAINEMSENEDGKAILLAMKEWEAARMNKAFPKELKRILQNPKKDFHLEAIKKGQWKLYVVPDAENNPVHLGASIIIPLKQPLDEKTVMLFNLD